MKLIPGVNYLVSSGQRSIQINVPANETATVNIKLNGSTIPAPKKYTESDVLSGFIGHGVISVENSNCEFNIQPENNIIEV